MDVQVLAIRDIVRSPWIKLQRIYYRYRNDNKDSSNEDESPSKFLNFDNLEVENSPYPKLPKNILYWDTYVRSHASNANSPDSVIIIPIAYSEKGYKHGDKIFLLLVEQFRPSQGKNTLEFPSGLIDQGESISDAAVRELKEETGYSGKLVKRTNMNSLSVICSDKASIVIALVNLDDTVNLTPAQELDETENIIVHKIEIESFSDFINTFSCQKNTIVCHTLYVLSLFISFMTRENLYELFCNIIRNG